MQLFEPSKILRNGTSPSFTAQLVNIVTIALAAVGVMTLISPTDETDRGRFERSGVQLRIDHGTGCQYLETRAGAITPRLTTSGEHMGCNSVERP